MNKRILHSVIVAALILGGSGWVSAAPQVEAAHSCCLAGEWVLEVTPPEPQSSGDFCCIAAEWRAEPLSPEAAVQSPRADSCCLASEWDAS